MIYNALFREFMRVRFDGVRPSGNRRSGTAASLEVRWAAAHKLRNRNLKWKRIGGDDPETDTNMVSTR